MAKEGTAGGYGAPLTQAYVSGSQSGAEYVAPQEVQRLAEAQARVTDYNVVALGDGNEPEYVAGWLFPSCLDAVWWLCLWLCLLRTHSAVSVSSLTPWSLHLVAKKTVPLLLCRHVVLPPLAHAQARCRARFYSGRR